MLVLVKLIVDSIVWVHLVQHCVLMHVQEDVRHVLIVADGNVVHVVQNAQLCVELIAMLPAQQIVLVLVRIIVFIVAQKYVVDVQISAILV